MAEHKYVVLDPKFRDGDHDRGTPRSIERANYQAYIDATGNNENVRVTDFLTDEIVLEGEFFNDPREPQSTIRTNMGPLGYHSTTKYYQGNPITSSVAELYRWIHSVLTGSDYVSPVEQLRQVGSPTWNETERITDLSVGMSEEESNLKDERGRTIDVAKGRPIVHNIVTGKDELLRQPVNCSIGIESKRFLYGPQENMEISLLKDGEPSKNIVHIERNRYLYIAPLGAIVGGSASKHKIIDKMLEYFYDVPVINGLDIRSGFRVAVGEEDEHVLYESKSDYIRFGQILGRPKTHVEVYDGAFKFDVVPKFEFWKRLQMPNPWFWKRYLWNKKYKGEETGFEEKRHALNFWSVLNEVDLRGENGYGGKIIVEDELIYSDLLYRFIKYSPEGEEEIGHIVLKRRFDDSEAVRKKERITKKYNPKSRQYEERTVQEDFVDTDKISAEYSINVFLEKNYEKIGPELMNMMLTLCGEIQHKLRLGHQPLERFDEYNLPTYIDDGLDLILTARNLNEPENWIGKAIEQDLTPLKIYHAVKELFGVKPPKEIMEYILWDEGRKTPAQKTGQATFDELLLRQAAIGEPVKLS